LAFTLSNLSERVGGVQPYGSGACPGAVPSWTSLAPGFRRYSACHWWRDAVIIVAGPTLRWRA
jgi:hypothetical protein